MPLLSTVQEVNERQGLISHEEIPCIIIRLSLGTQCAEIKEASQYCLKTALFCSSYEAECPPVGNLLGMSELSMVCIRGTQQGTGICHNSRSFWVGGKLGTLCSCCQHESASTNWQWQLQPNSPSYDMYAYYHTLSRQPGAVGSKCALHLWARQEAQGEPQL